MPIYGKQLLDASVRPVKLDTSGYTPTLAGDITTKDYVDSVATGFNVQNDVLATQTDNTLNPGVTPTTGDRYLITDASDLNANFGSIVGVEDNDIVEYDGANFVVDFDASVAGSGALVFSIAESSFFNYDGIAWNPFGGLTGTNAGAGLQKSGETIFVGAGSGILTSPTAVSVDFGTVSTEIAGNGLEVASGDLRIGGALSSDILLDLGLTNSFAISSDDSVGGDSVGPSFTIDSDAADAEIDMRVSATGKFAVKDSSTGNDYFSLAPGQGISGNGLTLTDGGINGFAITDNRTSPINRGLVYAADYSSNFGANSLVSRQYVDDQVASSGFVLTAGSGTTVGADTTSIDLGGLLTSDTTIGGDIVNNYNFSFTNLGTFNVSSDVDAITLITDSGADALTLQMDPAGLGASQYNISLHADISGNPYGLRVFKSPQGEVIIGDLTKNIAGSYLQIDNSNGSVDFNSPAGGRIQMETVASSRRTYFSNLDIFRVDADDQINLNTTTYDFVIDEAVGATFSDGRTPVNARGIQYLGFGEASISDETGVDYSGLDFNSLIPKKYVDDQIAAAIGGVTLVDGSGTTANGTAIDLGGDLTADTTINGTVGNTYDYTYNNMGNFTVNSSSDNIQLNSGSGTSSSLVLSQAGFGGSLYKLQLAHGSNPAGMRVNSDSSVVIGDITNAITTMGAITLGNNVGGASITLNADSSGSVNLDNTGYAVTGVADASITSSGAFTATAGGFVLDIDSSANQVTFQEARAGAARRGIQYLGFGEASINDNTGVDYSSLTFNSLVPRKYVDDAITGIASGITFNDGSIASPGIAFTTNTGTGFSHNGSVGDNSAIRVSTNGTIVANFQYVEASTRKDSTISEVLISDNNILSNSGQGSLEVGAANSSNALTYAASIEFTDQDQGNPSSIEAKIGTVAGASDSEFIVSGSGGDLFRVIDNGSGDYFLPGVAAATSQTNIVTVDDTGQLSSQLLSTVTGGSAGVTSGQFQAGDGAGGFLTANLIDDGSGNVSSVVGGNTLTWDGTAITDAGISFGNSFSSIDSLSLDIGDGVINTGAFFTDNTSGTRKFVLGVDVDPGYAITGSAFTIQKDTLPAAFTQNATDYVTMYSRSAAGVFAERYMGGVALNDDGAGDATIRHIVNNDFDFRISTGVYIEGSTETFQDQMIVDTTGVTIDSLSGSGTRLVAATATGQLIEEQLGNLLGAPSSTNLGQAPTVTTGDEASTGVTISSSDPKGFIIVSVNGFIIPLGDGVKTGYGYFSDDLGVTAKSYANLAVGDQLFWNGTVAGYDLDTTDVVDIYFVNP